MTTHYEKLNVVCFMLAVNFIHFTFEIEVKPHIKHKIYKKN
jgi:hypothetical protein